jgi:4-diphosphocytidyl-2C-methyl-D-erythritol kinase
MMDAARLQMHVVTATVYGTHTRHAPHHHVSIKLIAARSQHRAQQLKPLHANSQTQTAQHHFKLKRNRLWQILDGASRSRCGES